MAILRLNLDERNVRNLNLTNVVVVFVPPDHAKDAYRGTKLVPGNDYLFLGEVRNMPGHGIFVDQNTGTTLFGYHLENFYIQMEGIAVAESRNQYDETVYTVAEQEYEDVGSEDDEEDQQAIQKLMEKLKDCVSVYEHEIGDEPVIFIKNEGKIWTLKFNNQSFRLNISVE